MSGSGWAYAARAALWGVLMLLTLGLVLPWRAAALERYKMRHSYYGDLQGSFEGSGWDFFTRGWWLYEEGRLLVFSEYHKYLASKFRHLLVFILRKTS